METLEINVKAKGPEHEFISCKIGNWYTLSCGKNNYGLAHFCQVSAGVYDFIGPDGNRWFDGTLECAVCDDWGVFKVRIKSGFDGSKWKVITANIKIVEEA